MSVKAHYDNHLGNFYSWMAGDFNNQVTEHLSFYKTHKILPSKSGIALDLGAGHGLHSIPLAKLGFNIKAIDFNKQLLTELRENSKGLSVTVIEDDMRNFSRYANPRPEFIVCAGDTLTHLDSYEEVQHLLEQCFTMLDTGGKLMLSFRDYSHELKGKAKFIPVKSDDNRILTCILEYGPDKVTVTDLLHQRNPTGWAQKVSSYRKLRLSPNDVVTTLKANDMNILFHESIKGMITIIAEKK